MTNSVKEHRHAIIFPQSNFLPFFCLKAFVRKDALPLGTFSKYTWHITNILQVKQILDTPEVRADFYNTGRAEWGRERSKCRKYQLIELRTLQRIPFVHPKRLFRNIRDFMVPTLILIGIHWNLRLYSFLNCNILFSLPLG